MMIKTMKTLKKETNKVIHDTLPLESLSGSEVQAEGGDDLHEGGHLGGDGAFGDRPVGCG